MLAAAEECDAYQGETVDEHYEVQTQTYKISLKAAEFFNLKVEQRGIDVVVALIGPDGKKLMELDSPNGSKGLEPLFWIAETTGDYQLEIRSGGADAALGKYEARLSNAYRRGDKRECLPKALLKHKPRAERHSITASCHREVIKHASVGGVPDWSGKFHAHVLGTLNRILTKMTGIGLIRSLALTVGSKSPYEGIVSTTWCCKGVANTKMAGTTITRRSPSIAS